MLNVREDLIKQILAKIMFGSEFSKLAYRPSRNLNI